MSGPSTDELMLTRLARVEERAARLEAELAQRRDPAPNVMPALKQGLAGPSGESIGERRPTHISRAGFLRRAGALLAGAAGALLMEAHGTREAYATTTDTNFVANGFSGGGGTGFFVQSLANFSYGASLSGNVAGVVATGGFNGGAGVVATGIGGDAGVRATGGTSGGTGIEASGGGSGFGVVALGGGTNGAGVQAIAGGAGVGVIAVAGGVSAAGLANGQGVNATGSGSGPGVYATGGPTNGVGVNGTSGGSFGTGVNGVGLASGTGVYGFAPATGKGVWGFSPGNVGVEGQSNTGLGGIFFGGRAPINLNPAGSPGVPTSGAHGQGDVWVDSLGTVWMCSLAGTPGTFVPLQQGGLGNALFTAVSTQQYKLANSDGATWVDMDSTSATPLLLTITPAFKCVAVISGNADLWTANPGYNQDLGIFIGGGGYPTVVGQPEAWKESGGFAGTFSPNAAFVQTVKPLLAGTTYTIKLVWKTNKPASGVTIFAGAGPIGGKFSPSALTALLIASQ